MNASVVEEEVEVAALDKIIEQAIEHGWIIPGGTHLHSYSDIRKVLCYMVKLFEKEFPYATTAEFNIALRKYQPWKQYQFKGIKEEKVFVEISSCTLLRAEDHYRLTKKTAQQCLYEKVKDLFARGPQYPIFPEDQTIIHEEQPIVRPVAELIKINPCIALITAPGLGKTNAIIDYIAQLPRSAPVVAISFRVALSKKQKVDFAPFSFMHYADIFTERIDLDKHRRVIIQIDSLLRLTGQIKNITLVIDEWESLFDHLYNSPYIPRRNEIAEYFTDMVKRHSKRIILADANFTSLSNRFLRSICGLSPLIYHNTYIRQERIAHFLGGKGQMILLILERLRAREKLYVAVNSKLFGECIIEAIGLDPELCQRFDKNNNTLFKMFSSSTKLEDGMDPIHEMIKYDCCIVTPRFQAGNSFTEPHFDRVFGYFTAASCSPEAASQLLMRVRNVKYPDVYLVVDNRLAPGKRANIKIETFEEMHQYIMNKNHLRAETHNFLSSRHILTHLKFKFDASVDINDPATYLGLMCAFNTNSGHKNYVAHLVPLLCNMGFKFGSYTASITDKDKSINLKIARSMKQLRDMELNKLATKIALLPNVSETEYWDIVDNSENRVSLSEEECLKIKKYRLFRLFSFIQPDNPRDIERALKVKHIKKLMLTLLPLEEIHPQQKEQKYLQEVLEEVGKRPRASDPAFATQRFYDLNKLDKALMIGYLLSCVRALGFSGFLDPLEVMIDRSKLVNYIKNDNVRKQIESLFNKKFTSAQLNGPRIIQWLSNKLKIFGISIERKDKGCRKKNNDGDIIFRARLISPWRMWIVQNKVTILHMVLEINIPDDDYEKSYPATLAKLSNFPCVPYTKPKYVRESTAKSYTKKPQQSSLVECDRVRTWEELSKMSFNNISLDDMIAPFVRKPKVLPEVIEEAKEGDK